MTDLRLRLLRAQAREARALAAERDALEREIAELVEELGTSLPELFGLGPLGAAALLVEVGDPRRFRSADAFATYTGTAPIPASSAEAGGHPVHHRLSRFGNRRLNSVLHLMAVTRWRAHPETQAFIARATARGKTTRDALRIVKRRLARRVWPTMIHDRPAGLTQGSFRSRPPAPTGPLRSHPARPTHRLEARRPALHRVRPSRGPLDRDLRSFMYWEPRSAAESRGYVRRMLATQRARPCADVGAGRGRRGRRPPGRGLRPDPAGPGEADLGYVLAREAWGQGYATEAARALIAVGFAHLGLRRIEATSDPQNRASARVLEKAGLRRAGVLRRHQWAKGRWLDALRYEVHRDTTSAAGG